MMIRAWPVRICIAPVVIDSMPEAQLRCTVCAITRSGRPAFRLMTRALFAACVGWATLPMLDAYSPLIQILHTKEGNSGVFNWGGWSYPELDALVQQAGQELDTEKRLSLETQALKIAQDEIILIPLHQQPMSWAVGSDIKEMPQFPDNKPRLWYTKM